MAGAASRAMHDTARALARAPEALARVGAEAVADSIDRELARAVGGDRRISNLARRASPPRVTTRAGAAEVEAGGALWAILEDGTKAHTVKAKQGRDSRALRVNGQWRSGPVRVRGVRARHTFSNGARAGAEAAFAAQGKAWAKALH